MCSVTTVAGREPALLFDPTGRQASQHEMVLEETQPAGTEVWSCPECGRRVAIRWLPEWERVVLEPGAERAVHTGGTGGLRIGKVEVIPGGNAWDDDAE
jgi:hypothetical protein